MSFAANIFVAVAMWRLFNLCTIITGMCDVTVTQFYLLYVRCKDDYFGLSADDPLGCVPCFCYGHSSNCTASTNYVVDVIQSNFTAGACASLLTAFFVVFHSFIRSCASESTEPRRCINSDYCIVLYRRYQHDVIPCAFTTY